MSRYYQIENHTVGWLSVKQMYAHSIIMLTHKVLLTGVPRGIRQYLDTNFAYHTRRAEQGQIRFSEKIKGRGRTNITRTFRYQACVYFNMIPASLRELESDKLKLPLKKWVKQNIPVR